MRPNLVSLAVAAAMSMSLGRSLAPSGIQVAHGRGRFELLLDPKIDLPSRLIEGGKGKRKHRLSGRYSGKGRGNRSANPPAHQGMQECLRRVIGGWGFRRRFTRLTKRQTLEAIANVRESKRGEFVRRLEAIPA